MVNMSLFLTTCSVVKEEKYRLHNSIWFSLIDNCVQEKKREGEREIPFLFPFSISIVIYHLSFSYVIVHKY